MPRFRFTILEALAWMAWVSLYLGMRHALFMRGSFFNIEHRWIEAHLIVVWTAVAIDRFFRPNVRGAERYARGMLVGIGATTILAVETIVSTGWRDQLFEHFPSLWNSIPMFTTILVGGIVSGAISGLIAVLFYSFLTRRRNDRSPSDDPPRTPAPLPDNRSSAHDRAPP